MTVAITTQVTEQTLSVIESYKAVTMSDDDARDFATDLLEQAIVDIEANPLQYPFEQNALANGVKLRRWLDPTGKYICLFRYNQQTEEAILDILPAHVRTGYHFSISSRSPAHKDRSM